MAESLNSHQRAAIRYIDGPLLVLAGAGSGKTRVITEKIAYLIKQCGYHGNQILAVTFTNKAAREMKSRVAKLLPAQQGQGLRVSTFHTLGLGILGRDLSKVGRRSGFSIYDTQDCANLIREILVNKQLPDEDIKHLQWQISHIKNAPPGTDLGDTIQPHVLAIFETYQRLLQTYNAFDFDDLIREPVLLLQSDPDVREKWQNQVRYLLVDEYQDTNGMQYALIKLLTGVRGALTVVGDDDQSIYAWRGAQPQNMALLTSDFPRMEVIKLEQNYRSTGNILRAANHLIGHNSHLFEKKLWSALGPGDPIAVVSTRDEDHEVQWVVSDIMHHRHRQRSKFQDYAILYRSNHQSRAFEKMLREHNIPYFISGGTSFFALTEVKDIMAYLRLLVNPDDDAAFVRVVNTPKREIGATTLEKLAQYARQRETSLFGACFELGLEQFMAPRIVQRLRQFVDWLVAIGDQAKRSDPVAAVKDLINEISYEQWLKDTSKDLTAAKRRMENVTDIVAWLQRLVEQDRVGENIDQLVGHLSLMDILERQDEEDQGDRVTLMTLHGAKGLEFPYLYMVGMEEGLLPHKNSVDADTVEEERRLAYVGITRARRRLALTFARNRRRGGEWSSVEPSRFLQELPQDLLSWEGGEVEVPAEEQKRRGQERLAGLRGMLANQLAEDPKENNPRQDTVLAKA